MSAVIQSAGIQAMLNSWAVAPASRAISRCRGEAAARRGSSVTTSPSGHGAHGSVMPRPSRAARPSTSCAAAPTAVTASCAARIVSAGSLLQGRPVQRRDAQTPGHSGGHGADAVRGLHERRTAAHARRAAEQAAGRRDTQQRGAGSAARRLTRDRHPAGVSAEGRDVLLHPLQRADPVAHGPVGRGAGHLEEALGTEPVVDADQDDAVPRERPAAVPG